MLLVGVFFFVFFSNHLIKLSFHVNFIVVGENGTLGLHQKWGSLLLQKDINCTAPCKKPDNPH